MCGLLEGGYLPGDIVRWCRRAHLRASVLCRTGSPRVVTEALETKARSARGEIRFDVQNAEGAPDLGAINLQKCLSTALVEVVPASLVHPWEVTPSSRSTTSGAEGIWTALAGYEGVKSELRRILAWPEQHFQAWYVLSTSSYYKC